MTDMRRLPPVCSGSLEQTGELGGLPAGLHSGMCHADSSHHRHQVEIAISNPEPAFQIRNDEGPISRRPPLGLIGAKWKRYIAGHRSFRKVLLRQRCTSGINPVERH